MVKAARGCGGGGGGEQEEKEEVASSSFSLSPPQKHGQKFHSKDQEELKEQC